MTYWNDVLSTRVRRRRAVALFGGGVTAAFLVACGGGDKEPSPGANSASNEKDVKRGGNLRIGFEGNIVSPDPHNSTGGNRYIMYQVYDTLTRHNADRQPGPRLVQSWELSDRGATLVFKLRQGVTFHSGREFTSEDVLWNFKRVGDASGPFALYRELANWFQTIEAPDKYTVVLKSDKPRPAVFDYMETFVMADKATVEDKTTFNGTGPWKWAEWRQGQSIKLQKNPKYWTEGSPYLDELTWMITLEGETALAHLEAGALDMVWQPGIPAFLRFQKNKQFQTLLSAPYSRQLQAMGMNTRFEPFGDKRVRQAFNWAVDRKRWSDLIMGGLAQPVNLPWAETSVAYNKEQNNHFSLNLSEATKLLRAANATNLSTTMIAGNSGILPTFLPVYQNDLKSIGVDLKINNLDSAAFAQAVNGRRYQSVYAGATTNSAISAPFSIFVTSPAWKGDGDSHSGFVNKRYVDLVEQASVEFDINKQRTLYREINDIILDESFIMLLSWDPIREIMASKVKGMQFDYAMEIDPSRAWLA